MAAQLPLPLGQSIPWPGREVPLDYLVANAGGDLERFIHLTPRDHPMARYVVGFAACPRWRTRGHRNANGEELLTLWLTPSTARCTSCDYLETLDAFMARRGWELS